MVGGILHNLAGGHFEAGRMDEAAALEERALAIYEAHAALAGPALADCLHSLGRIRQQQGRTAEARKLAARAQQLGYQKSEDGVISIGISEDQVGSSYRDSAK
jgi:tetratricopeptide (TPR) repeat protein